MTAICAWCKRMIGRTGDEGGETHGICTDCQRLQTPGRDWSPPEIVEIMWGDAVVSVAVGGEGGW